MPESSGRKRWIFLVALLGLVGLVIFLLVRRSGAGRSLPEAGQVVRERVPQAADAVRRTAPEAARRVLEQAPVAADAVKDASARVVGAASEALPINS